MNGCHPVRDFAAVVSEEFFPMAESFPLISSRGVSGETFRVSNSSWSICSGVAPIEGSLSASAPPRLSIPAFRKSSESVIARPLRRIPIQPFLPFACRVKRYTETGGYVDEAVAIMDHPHELLFRHEQCPCEFVRVEFMKIVFSRVSSFDEGEVIVVGDGHAFDVVSERSCARVNLRRVSGSDASAYERAGSFGLPMIIPDNPLGSDALSGVTPTSPLILAMGTGRVTPSQ